MAQEGILSRFSAYVWQHEVHGRSGLLSVVWGQRWNVNVGGCATRACLTHFTHSLQLVSTTEIPYNTFGKTHFIYFRCFQCGYSESLNEVAGALLPHLAPELVEERWWASRCVLRMSRPLKSHLIPLHDTMAASRHGGGGAGGAKEREEGEAEAEDMVKPGTSTPCDTLHEAAYVGNDTAVLAFLESDPDHVDDAPEEWNGGTPLCYSAMKGHVACARVLLRAGASTTATLEGRLWRRLAWRGGVCRVVCLLTSHVPVACCGRLYALDFGLPAWACWCCEVSGSSRRGHRGHGLP